MGITSQQYAPSVDVDDALIEAFQDAVWSYYDDNARNSLPWRQPDGDGHFSPYNVMVSELMLQQTQVSRAIPKYADFLQRFPNVQALADSSLADVLVAWQGLGYNRRAKFLWQAAKMVVDEFDGNFPKDQASLVALPGVGINTAGAIAAYAYAAPAVFIETNIRTVFIHHFFGDQATDVHDRDIAYLVARSLPGDNRSNREWYWALMDYGTHIKRQFGNKSKASRSYVKQSPFEGSRRKVRGAVLRYLSQQPGSLAEMRTMESDGRLESVVDDLIAEGMVSVDDAGVYRLAS